MLNCSEKEIADQISRYESEGIIKGYTSIIDEAAVDPNAVTALIELKVTPQSQSGYDEIAREIAEYEEVESVRLMSGAYDIIVSVTGSNIREISQFVSARLAAIDAVTSTATHFQLKAYKGKRHCHNRRANGRKRYDLPMNTEDYDKLLNKNAVDMKPSGIRKFFDIAQQIDGVISLGVGEPDSKHLGKYVKRR